ncbi:MAG: sugar-binding protein [Candidatus Poribacteria bacterium]
MKLRILLVLVCLSFSLAPICAQAHIVNPETGKAFLYKAQLAEVAPVVDGILDDPAWEKAEIAKMEWESLQIRLWEDMQDFEGQFAAVWKNSTLYVAVQIKDDQIINDLKLKSRDSLEVYVDVENYSVRSDLYKNTIVVKENKVRRQSLWAPFVAWDNSGQTCEMSFYLGNVPKKGVTIGFGIYYNDVDNGRRENQIGWTPERNPPGAKEQLGDLLFDVNIKTDNKKLGTTWGNIKKLY